MGPWDYCLEHRPAWREREQRRFRIECPDCREFALRWWELNLQRRGLTDVAAWEALYLVGELLDHFKPDCGTHVENDGLQWALPAIQLADRELTRTFRGYRLQRREAATRVLARLVGVSQRTIRRRGLLSD